MGGAAPQHVERCVDAHAHHRGRHGRGTVPRVSGLRNGGRRRRRPRRGRYRRLSLAARHEGGGLALVGLVSGLILLGVAAAATRRDARATHWASTPGTIGWAAPICHAGVSPSTPYRSEPPTTVCMSRIYYGYRVGDRDYTGTRVTFNDLLLHD